MIFCLPLYFREMCYISVFTLVGVVQACLGFAIVHTIGNISLYENVHIMRFHLDISSVFLNQELIRKNKCFVNELCRRKVNVSECEFFEQYLEEEYNELSENI